MPHLHMQVCQPKVPKEKLDINGFFVLSKSRDLLFMKRIESLLKIAGMKFEFLIRFHKRQVSFLVVKTV